MKKIIHFLKNQSLGFTLLEILLVVGIIAILAGMIIVAISPDRQLAATRNAIRIADIGEIKKATTQFYIDNGYYPTAIDSNLTEICDTGASSTPTGIDCTDLIDLSALVPTYITAVPKDPSATTATGYKIKIGNGKIIVLPKAALSLESVGFSSVSNYSEGRQYKGDYYSPRVNFGDEDLIPYHDDETATEWCRNVNLPDGLWFENYTEGNSVVSGDNPQDGYRYRYIDNAWLEINGGDSPAYYTCGE